MSDKKHSLGDAPIEAMHHRMMNTIAGVLDEAFNGVNAGPKAKGQRDERRTGFVLLVFPFDNMATRGGDSRCNFISNGADRKDIVALFREMIARFEGQPETQGTA